jgi:hypothetical protein
MCLQACVGSVEESLEKNTISTNSSGSSTVQFDGVYEIVPISDTKIEVYFPSATNGSLKYTYLIYVDSQPEPISVAQEVLEKDYRGYFRYTVNNLQIGTQYSVKVDVKDIDDDFYFSTDTALSAFTFSNHVADFSGISLAENVAGVDGVDSIKVRWAHAAVPGGIFDNGEGPSRYEIVLLDSEKLTPAAFDDSTLSEAAGRIVKVVEYNPLITETVVRGLKASTSYYIAVRCIHEGSVDDPTNVNLRGEINHRYKEVRTLSADASSISFNETEFEILKNTGFAATNSLLVNWGDIFGIFDHYRIFYAKTPNLVAFDTTVCYQGNSNDLATGVVFCKKVSIDKNQAVLAHLNPQTEYQVSLAICLDSFCNDYIMMQPKTQETIADLALFNGISSITLARNINELGKLYLNYGAPDFTTGYFDGLAIEFTTNKADILAYVNGVGPKPTTYLIKDEPNVNHDLTHTYFDYTNETQVRINGLDYASKTDYCFAIYPFNYDINATDGRVYYDDGAIWECILVEPIAPTRVEFEGVASAESFENDVRVYWDTPTKGVYSHFEIFYRKASGSGDSVFSFDNAIFDTTVNYDFTSYNRILIDKDGGSDAFGNPIEKTSFEIPNLENGYYLFGINTYFNGGFGNVVRSENNQTVFRCYLDGATLIRDCSEI